MNHAKFRRYYAILPKSLRIGLGIRMALVESYLALGDAGIEGLIAILLGD
jgi:hypothetical protein